jgi:GH15 family glucan-1,4-alpha-glucosidase
MNEHIGQGERILEDGLQNEGRFLKLQRSIESILRNQKSNGAIIASPDFDQYHYCWLRDGSFCAYALDEAGEHEASALYHSWASHAIEGISAIIDDVIARSQRGERLDPLHMPPARFSLGGSTVTDDWPNFQIDGYGTWLWSLGRHFESTGQAEVPDQFRESVVRVGRYLAALSLSPCYDVWEESGTAIHTSTLACVYGGLVTAGRLTNDDSLLAAAETVRGRLLDDASRHGAFVKSSESNAVDASLLWLSTPFAVVAPDDARLAVTVERIVSELTFDGGLRRYPTDTFYGSGAWPVLTGSLGLHYLARGDTAGARRCRDWISDHFDRLGRLGEQFGGEQRDSVHYREWVERWGPPAQDLTWSHAMYVVLSIAIANSNSDEMGERGLLSSVELQAIAGTAVRIEESKGPS